MSFKRAGDVIRRATLDIKEEGSGKRVSSLDVYQRIKSERNEMTKQVEQKFRGSVCAVRSNLELDILRHNTTALTKRQLGSMAAPRPGTPQEDEAEVEGIA